ncbi:hypothetical protein R2537_007004 [Pseudomonas aeruginosa]|nr:hypothetical protein [Pseudomonas aeruginosa]
MTQQDDITQRVLTDDEIMRSAISACDSLNITRFHAIGAPSKTIMDDAGLLELGRAIESAVLSKLRAPVADERAADGYTPSHDQPQQTGVGEWCAPGPATEQRRAWLLRFADTDRGDCVYYDEQEARRAFAQAEGRGWNCYLFEYARRAALASAPVAGEAVAHAVIAYGRIQRIVANEESAHEHAEQHSLNAEAAGWNAKAHVRPLVYGDAAPQASAEDVRNAALEEAAAVAKRISDKYAFGHYGNETDTADEIEREILALKAQAGNDGDQQPNWINDWSAAIKSLPMGRSEGVVDKSPNLQGSSVDKSTDLQGDKDGGQQRAGDAREALSWYAEQVADCRKFGSDGDAARQALDKDGGQRARAALSATQAGQGERDA